MKHWGQHKQVCNKQWPCEEENLNCKMSQKSESQPFTCVLHFISWNISPVHTKNSTIWILSGFTKMAISHSALLLFSLNYCLDDELLSVLSWNIFWTIKQIYFGEESKYIWSRKQIHMDIYFGQWNKYIPDKKAGHDSVLFLFPHNIWGATLRLHPRDFMIFLKFE